MLMISDSDQLVKVLEELLLSISNELEKDDLAVRALDHGEWGISFSEMSEFLKAKGAYTSRQRELVLAVMNYFGRDDISGESYSEDIKRLEKMD